MKLIYLLAVMIGLAAIGASAQTNVTTTGGTPGHLPQFNGATTIGDSPIFQ